MIKIWGIIMIVGGLKVAITGQAGQRTDYASGDYVRILGIICVILGLILFYSLVKKK